MKRSIYMERAVIDDIAALAKKHCRTWASECSWLVMLGLQARKQLPKEPCKVDEGATERKYFYPDDKLCKKLDAQQARLNRRRRKDPWTFSAMMRAQLVLGMRIEQQIARGVDAALARMGSDEHTPHIARSLAETLIAKHTVDELIAMRSRCPPDIRAFWGRRTARRWSEIVGVALECVGLLTQLEDEEPNEDQDQDVR